jgi:signal transduction histidine kinase
MDRLPLHLESIDAFEYVSGFLEERQSLKPDPHEFVLVSDDPKVRVNVDVGRLDQVMSNLASNAVKYSPADKPVEFGMWAESEGVTIVVRDYGIGLEQGDPDRIFQPFQRSRAAIASNAPGMGLGLFISRNIIERHHGTLTASSEGSGLGSTFRIWLPADTSSQSDS